MKKIDFQHMKIYTGVSHKTAHACDAREMFADLIYQQAGGIRAHALAFKIYESEGETEYTPDEEEMIKEIAERHCIPGFIDGLNEQIGKQPKE
ncbi:MAG: hypothetical protein K2H16_06165 [Prevotella sp.]|nr:hypothetical protein [Prevotella sp.]MDE6152009.1 hypothetical protein [Prevotella sp.]